MKAIYYIIALILIAIAVGCRSTGMLMEKGEYDKAVVHLTEKISGAKEKKIGQIKSLEEGLEKANQSNLSKIYLLTKQANNGKLHLWEEVYEQAAAIEKRQSPIKALMPIVSKDGYEGQFVFFEVATLKNEAAAKAMAYLYETGTVNFLHAINTRNKNFAQKAFESFDRISLYDDNYKDAASLKSKSRHVGTYNILLKVYNDASVDEVHIALNPHNTVADLNSWIEYHKTVKEGVVYDAVAEISIDDIEVSPDKESVDSDFLRRSVPIKVESGGNDSLSTSSASSQIEIITVENLTRTKKCRILASMKLHEYRSGAKFHEKSFEYIEVFESKMRSYSGNTNPTNLQGTVPNGNNRIIAPFPFAQDMIIEGINEISEDISRYISKLNTHDLHRDLIALK